MENLNKIIKDLNKNPYNADELNQEQLEKIIELANDKFFNTDQPVMNDAVYDILIDFLKTKYPKSKVLKEIGAKVKSKNKVTLDYWLGSMNKFKPSYTKELDKWFKKYKGHYLLSDKLDGISALLVYRSNNTINLYTRGTAEEGLDITSLIKYLDIPDISAILKSNIRADKKDILMAFRGELIITKNNFENKWSNVMKNARNMVAGIVNSKTINPTMANDVKFIVYEIVDPLLTPENQLKISKKLGFDIVHYKIVSDFNFESLSKYFKKRRNDSEYVIDGIIVTNNEINQRNTKANPEYAFAFKDILDDQMAITKVLSIEWNISKDGLIKPTLLLEPVNIGGVEISRVTGHNAKNIVDNKLGKGAIIELIRSGDVIPYVQKVIKPATKIDLPEGEWEWNSSNVDIVSKISDSNEILIKNIYHFFSTLDAKGLGEKIIEKMVLSNLNSVKKILNATKEELMDIEGFKEKLSQNILDSIKKCTTNIKLSKLMAASNKLGHGIGEERIKQILDNYPNLLSIYKKWSEEEFINKLKELNGWEDKTSSLFVSNFNEFIKFYNGIKDLITLEIPKEKEITKNKYTDKTIVLSGFRDSNLQQFLENLDAKITNSISKNTNLLIVKDQATIDEGTGKVQKALELNIPIVTKDQIKY